MPTEMKYPRLLISCLLTACLFASSYPQTPVGQDDVIRVETDLTNLFFTATNKHKNFVITLREEDIALTEDGVPQKIVTFQRETDRPLTIAVLIDVSASQERTLSQEKGAARSFIETIIQSSKDEVAIIPFTHAAFVEQGLTRDVLGIYRALERVEVAMPTYLGTGPPLTGITSGPGMKAPPLDGSTAIWEAVVLSAHGVLATSRGQRRRAIILLTDGQDTSSRLMRSEAIREALATETVVYGIGIGDKRYGIDHAAVRAIAEGTGGRAFFPKRDGDLKAAFAQIEQELRSQYLVAYTSTNKKRDGAYRQMNLAVTNPALQKDKLQLRYRPGYYAIESRPQPRKFRLQRLR